MAFGPQPAGICGPQSDRHPHIRVGFFVPRWILILSVVLGALCLKVPRCNVHREKKAQTLLIAQGLCLFSLQCRMLKTGNLFIGGGKAVILLFENFLSSQMEKLIKLNTGKITPRVK